MSLRVAVRHHLPALDMKVDFEAPGGVTVLFGRSGAGKSTIANIVAGLVTPDHGQVLLGDIPLFDQQKSINLPTHKRQVGYIFQESRLFPHMTVGRNLTYGQRFRSGGQDIAHVSAMLGLESLMNRRPKDLSGGEKQRVAIGRALLSGPRLLIADEPLSSLDEARKLDILPYFERLRDEAQVPILYVTHSVSEVARLATTIVGIEDGKVTQSGRAEDILSDPGFAPASVRAVGAVLSGRVIAHHDDGLSEIGVGTTSLLIPRTHCAVGHSLRLRIPAQDVFLSLTRPVDISALNILDGVIRDIRLGDGPGAIISLSTDAGPILARITQRSLKAMDLRTGTRCYAIAKTVSVAQQNVGG